MHSVFDLGRDAYITPAYVDKLRRKIEMGKHANNVPYQSQTQEEQRCSFLYRQLRDICLLIIDEISMLRPELLWAVSEEMKAARGRRDAFGGCQVMFVGDAIQIGGVPPLQHLPYRGDFYDSPPDARDWLAALRAAVNDPKKANKRAKIRAEIDELQRTHRPLQLENAYTAAAATKVPLTRNYRQSDDERFQALLDELRTDGCLSDDSASLLATRAVRSADNSTSTKSIVAHSNDTVNLINREFTEKLDLVTCEVALRYSWRVQPDADDQEADDLRRELRTRGEDAFLELCSRDQLDARQTSRAEDAWTAQYEVAIGSKAILVEAVDRENDLHKNAFVQVEAAGDNDTITVSRKNKQHTIGPVTLTHENDAGKYTITCIPLKPAYATTVNKCQGMTLPDGVRIVLDLHQLRKGPPGWWPGSVGYTAITRAKRLQDVDIVIDPDNPASDIDCIKAAFTVDKRKIDFYKSFL